MYAIIFSLMRVSIGRKVRFFNICLTSYVSASKCFILEKLAALAAVFNRVKLDTFFHQFFFSLINVFIVPFILSINIFSMLVYLGQSFSGTM